MGSWQVYGGRRPPVAFVAGVLGPLVGADLLHLRDIARMHVGILSIGGAETFNGIVLAAHLSQRVPPDAYT